MKKHLNLLLLMVSISCASYGQMWWNIDFEDPAVFDRIFIDTIANPGNTWQIGVPGKTLFNSAHSPTHVIITDTLNPYPVNNTSAIIITHVREQPPWGANIGLLLDFYFKMDSDTLTDYGKVELSVDNGQTWYDVMTLDTLFFIEWLEPKPALSGSIPEWTHFSVNLSNVTYVLGFSDTLLYRFTFVSDGNQTNKEGWMIDDFTFQDLWEGIEEHRDDGFITVSPNPASDFLTITRKTAGTAASLEIVDISGRSVWLNPRFCDERIDIRSLCPGTYLVRYSDSERTAIKKFIVVRETR